MFVAGETVAREGDPIDHVVIFPASGLIACTILLGGGKEIETALLGNHDAFRRGRFWVPGTSLRRDRLPPDHRISVKANVLAEIADDLPDFRAAMLKNEWFTLTQAQHVCACCACHSVGQRFASWLLQAADANGHSELTITQQNLGHLMGVQRASLSIVATDLQERGFIDYRRGRIWIKDREGLEQQACTCARTLREKRLGLSGTLDAHEIHHHQTLTPITGDQPHSIV